MLVLQPGSACWAPAGCWTRTSVGSLRSQPGSPVSQTENAGARWELGTWACCAQLLHSYPVSCAHLLRQREGPEPAHSRTEHRRGLGWVTPLLVQSWGPRGHAHQGWLPPGSLGRPRAPCAPGKSPVPLACPRAGWASPHGPPGQGPVSCSHPKPGSFLSSCPHGIQAVRTITKPPGAVVQG